MPTGYTAKLHDGEQSVRDFILTCARAMGATIMQRDDALDVPPLPQTADVTYYDQRIIEATARISEAQGWSDEDAVAHADAKHAEEIAAWRERVAKTSATVARYEAMRAQVQAWQPPTPEHQGLKKFMLDQLAESIRFDGMDWDLPKPAQSGAAYRADVIEGALRAVEYAEEQRAAEIKRTEARNRWIADLYAALPEAVSA